MILTKTGNSPFAEAVECNINNDEAREALIQKATVVISMMPPALHFLIAKDCVENRKHLLTASYLDHSIKSLQDEINHKKLLFLCEMGLDPGIDHMSAMKLIDKIKQDAGRITSFKSHCGGLVAPGCDDNPWRYKISWNPRNVVLAGNAGAIYLQDGATQQVAFAQLFHNSHTVNVDGLDALAYYPNRDSLSYIPVYKLQSATTFMRTTLRYPAYFAGWSAIVDAGLTNDTTPLSPMPSSYKSWSAAIAPFVNEQNEAMLNYLGLFSHEPLPASAQTSADVLQYLLETKLAMQPTDRDMIVMLHQLEYECKGVTKKLESSLVVEGADSVHTAMAKTVGLPLGIAAKLILNGTLQLTGLHIPILKEIYEPVLEELEHEHIRFVETEMD